MTDTATLKLPTNSDIELFFFKDLVATFNAFAPTAGLNPVKTFASRNEGVRRLTKLADELRAKGISEPSAPVDFPVVAKAAASKAEAAKVDIASKAAVAKKAPAPKAKPAATPKAKDAPAPKAAPAKPAKAVKAPPTQIEVGKRGTLGARLRELILDPRELDNAAIWEIVQKEYDLDANKRGYVAGQRVAMVKREAAAEARAAAEAKAAKKSAK
jgi:hypothetical protein